MSLQARMSANDARFYNPSRDYAHNFAKVAETVADHLEEERWDEINRYLKITDTDMEQLGLACKAFVSFVAGSCDDPEETIDDVFKRVGWDELPEPAKVAMMAYLGAVLTGCYFKGVREATINGSGPLDSVSSLVKSGDRAYYLLALPRWRRRLTRLKKFALRFRRKR